MWWVYLLIPWYDFYQENMIKKDARRFLFNCFFIFLNSLLVSLILFIFSKQISQIIFANNTLIVKILALILIFSSLNILFQYFFITSQQIKRYSFLLCFKTFTQILLISGFIFFGKGVIGAAIGFYVMKSCFSLLVFQLFI